MKFIKKIEIHSFRSCENMHIENCENFNVFLGLNNSGKSNILRALNLFFNGEIEPGFKFLLERDGNFPPKKRKKKEVEISITFDTRELKKLPQFKKAVGNIVDDYVITKVWGYQGFSEGLIVAKGKDQLDKAQNLLKFIRFRYLVAHRDPAKIIIESEKRIRKELLRRFNSRIKKSQISGGQNSITEVLKILEDASKSLIDPIALPVKSLSPEVKDLILLTPKTFQDLVISLGYAVQLKNEKMISEELQGSGFQSHLMFRVLYFADTAYSLDFGWKGITIWAIEEPESFLHKNLEIELGKFFNEISEKFRIQIFCTTHSDVFPQYAKMSYLAKFDDLKYSQLQYDVSKKIIHESSKLGISSFVHTLHFQQGVPLVLVEGKTDKKVVNKTLELLGDAEFFSIFDNFDLNLDSGGVSQLLKYLQNNKLVIDSRQKPFYIILDWNEENKTVNQFKKISKNIFPYKFDESKCNPNLDNSFSGIERYLTTDFIKNPATEKTFSYQTDSVNSSILSMKKRVLDDNKVFLADYFVKNASKLDLKFLEPEIKKALHLS
ncbi:MAG: AAA family ATPase [Candidatus Niyogibacteria bacterium]|nr:MAG: AAA family ATPase [Candidatus Niyogibacteria bacterium]